MTNPGGSSPRHGHRTPAELAEDEVIAALRGEAREVFIPDDVLPDRTRRVRLRTGDSKSIGADYALRGK
jgi:hypothetical protein